MLIHLRTAEFREIVRRALDEDVGTEDVTTEAIVPRDARGRGAFLVKAECVLAGLDVAVEAFRLLDPDVRVASARPDGERCRAGEVAAYVTGRARALLTGERTALNFLQRLSGIATRTRQFVDAAGGRITLLDTRKTTPTLRALERYAVRAGGGTNHRSGLFDAILIKDNHIRIAGGVREAVSRARRARADLRIEIEAQTLEQVAEALEAGAEAILLDNFPMSTIREAVELARGRARTEISGGVTLEVLPALSATGADFVSVGALTHSAPAVDISFEVEPLPSGELESTRA